MPEVHILRLRRTDTKSSEGPSHILLHVEQSGSRPLDLKLIATEYEHLYHASIQGSTVKSLQASNYSGNLDEWKAIIQHALLLQRPDSVSPDTFDGLETLAAISGDALTVTFRKNISGITQRLGSLELKRDDEREEVVFPEWVDTAVAASDALRDQLATLQACVTEQQRQVAKLTQQLDELVQAKKDHEDELLKKFAALLNSKKLKIRDQQRLLAGADIDPSVANGRAKRVVGSSRQGKRKANGGAPHGEEDDDAVMADGDEAATEDEDDGLQRRVETPQASDRDETEDEDSDASGFDAAPVPSQASKHGVGRKGKALEGGMSSTRDRSADVVHDSQPQQKELPYGRKNGTEKEAARPASQKPPPPPPVPAGQDDDEETDDEEL